MAFNARWTTPSGKVENLPVTLLTHAKLVGSEIKNIVVALHGYGDNAQNFASLADEIRSDNTLWLAVQGPKNSPHGFGGAQWYDLFGDPKAEVENSFAQLSTFLETVTKATNTPMKNTFLFGFSQGAYLSLYTGLRLKQPLAGVIALSGYLAQHHRIPTLSDEMKSMPIFLAHGNQDQVVLPHMYFETKDVLASLGMSKVEAHLYNNLGHSICPDEARHIEKFLKEHG